MLTSKLQNTIQPGELRHRIQIAQPTDGSVVDDIGGISQNPAQWTVARACWASIDAVVGEKNLDAGQQLEKTSHRIVIRNPRTSLPTAGMLVWFQTRTFQINAVLNPTEQNKLLILLCEELNQSVAAVPTPSAE